ncbi:MAG: aminotransferase class V-fold PLP-dependent enzyme [Hyphomicrobiales bacterium]|nr:aminotransferase class V-fold PLP-dependent enzyme [Hyphomicrobiales bacterium]
MRAFERELSGPEAPIGRISAGLIGGGVAVPGSRGPRKLVYADYFGSGRALRQVEEFVSESVLPFYANSHTESSFCGAYTTRLRERSRQDIARRLGAGDAHAVIFAGSGATGGINRLVHLFGLDERSGDGPSGTVLVGPYEHHSNLLPWRESRAEVIEIAEGPLGGPDLAALEDTLAGLRGDGPIVAAFSAASNVTGICADVVDVTRVVKRAGGRIVWDYAGGGPYLPISMTPAPGVEIDAVVVSPHKFIGGPGASGLLIVRRDAVTAERPSAPGGGTVAFVNRDVHDYLPRLEDYEEGGTPNIIGDIRAALAVIVKDVIGQSYITSRNAALVSSGMAALRDHPHIDLLAADHAERLPVFSFIVRDNDGGIFDHQAFTRMLSDEFGIQARGGCACAAPYAHQLLGIDDEHSVKIRQRIKTGSGDERPGFVRLNLSYLMTDETVEFILNSVRALAESAATRSGTSIVGDAPAELVNSPA